LRVISCQVRQELKRYNFLYRVLGAGNLPFFNSFA